MASKNRTSDLGRWVIYLQEQGVEQAATLSVPLHVTFGEAVDVAKFHAKYWKNRVDEEGNVVLLGLESAVQKGERKGSVAHLSAETGDEILSLQRSAQEAQTLYLLTVGPSTGASPMTRGQFLLNEIATVVAWYFNDGVEDEKDQMLSRIQAAHADDPVTIDALASALDDYAHLAERYRAEIDGLGGFAVAHIDEAVQVAAALRERPAQAQSVTISGEARQALDLRNDIVSLLLERMNVVRAAARFVYRTQPEIVREATSAYERRRRAKTRKSQAKQAEPKPAPVPAPVPAPTPAVS